MQTGGQRRQWRKSSHIRLRITFKDDTSYYKAHHDASLLFALLSQGASMTTKSIRMLPNGHFIAGTPRRAPDGTYVGGEGPITRAPDGSYVAGTPQRAPDGTYKGGGGPVRMAPDGTFVVGPARRAPDGTYL
jgi:hypothetical protein